MTEIRKLWSPDLPPIPEDELDMIERCAGPVLAQAAGCFWLFRCLHREPSQRRVLMGDYCFGRFSHHLAAIDSVELTNAFSDYLRSDTLRETDIKEFLRFTERASRII